MGGKNTWELSTFDETHKFTVSTNSANSKQDKYEENHTKENHIQTVGNKKIMRKFWGQKYDKEKSKSEDIGNHGTQRTLEHIFNLLNEKKIKGQLRILSAVNIVFKKRRQNKDCFRQMRLKFITTKPTLQEMLKQFLQTEKKIILKWQSDVPEGMDTILND